MSFVVDASVVAKYLVADVESDKAEAFLREWTQARFDLLAPEILPMEVASTLWKRVRRGLVPADKACTLYDKFIRLCIPLMPIEDLAEPALRLALHYGHSVYDGLYVALAQTTGWTLITADEKLCKALIPRFSQVRLLREWCGVG